jgi:hypothetical protein
MSFGLSKDSSAFDSGSDEDDDKEAVSAWFTDAITSNTIVEIPIRMTSFPPLAREPSFGDDLMGQAAAVVD